MGSPQNQFLLASSINAATDIGSAFIQGSSLRAQGEFSKKASSINAQILRDQAKDAEKRGKVTERQLRTRGKRLVSSQKVSLAAQGIDITTGSARDIQDETLLLLETDAATIRNNALREAFGFETEAISEELRGSLSQLTAESRRTSTLLTGGVRAFRDVLPTFQSKSGRPSGRRLAGIDPGTGRFSSPGIGNSGRILR